MLAGLQAMPDELNEAATLDGYGPVRRFFRVTVPLISPDAAVPGRRARGLALQAYAQIEILTGAGRRRHRDAAVQDRPAQEPATGRRRARMALGLFGVTLLVTLAQFLMLNRRVHYGN